MPYIKPDIIEQIWESADLVKVISDYVALKKSGANYKGLSPWTKEKSGSFMVSPSKGIWKDFSSGKGGNSAVSFIMQHSQVSYPEAIAIIAKKYSITLEYDDSAWSQEQHKKQERRQELGPLLEATVRKYEEAFAALPKNHPAKLEVFSKRQYTLQEVEDYRIGYAPGGNYIYSLCAEQGRVEDAKELGIIKDYGDFWKDRVIYPLIDRRGATLQPVGLAGRSLTDNKQYAKWMNSIDSELYTKEKFWYGMDKARDTISKTGEAWLVEGYNDVIAWQTHGILNTIASCGTAISLSQMKLLRKICERIVFCFDPDGAGKRAMLKYIKSFLKQGFRVHVVFLNKQEGAAITNKIEISKYLKEQNSPLKNVSTIKFAPALDPDDFVRYYKIGNKKPNLSEGATDRQFWEEGFKFLIVESLKGKDDVETITEAKKLAQIVKNIEDEAMRIIYAGMLQQESGCSKTQINAWLKPPSKTESKTFLETSQQDLVDGEFYKLPKHLNLKIEDVESTIKKYSMFMAGNQIWIQTGDRAPFHFKAVSNFSIDIIQHMQDEKFPMKLVRMANVHGLSRVFDMKSAEMNTPNAFENAVTAHGNFRWKGDRNEHELLKTFLFDAMGTGRKIDVLGWQPEGFWVWNNKITIPKNAPITVDENGVFQHEDVSYYVPSANKIYRSNIYKYEAQKKVYSNEVSDNFLSYSQQLIKVHREHAMMGILFSVASMFQDIVVSEINFFPMLFLFGPASSGKDQLADVCQSFFGQPQTAINLEGGVSTVKAQVREFAQFCNMISQLSEYKNGNPQLDGMLKGLWDRRGYKRGNIDSHVGTESIPILSSVLITGNYAPDQEALITRLIWNFMDKTTFSDEETKEYEKLSDMTKRGISGFTDIFLNDRELVKNNFKYKYREFKATLGQRRKDANSRMIANLSVLGTFFQIFQNNKNISFPFSHADMMAHFERIIDKQMNKMNSASIINRWWDCFLASMRGTTTDQIRDGRDFKMEGDYLYFNFTACYNRVQRQWYTQYKDTAPAKGVMQDALKDDKAWMNTVAAVRMAPGKNSKSTSAYLVNLKEIPVSDDIKFSIDFQRNEHTLFQKSSGIFDDDEEDNDLPFMKDS